MPGTLVIDPMRQSRVTLAVPQHVSLTVRFRGIEGARWIGCSWASPNFPDTSLSCDDEPGGVSMEKGEKQERRRYTQEFKLEAIRLVRTGIAKARVARDLGIHLSVLKAWLRQFDQDPDNPFPGKGKMKPEEAEIFRLKRELMKVTAERDILKKALAYFAKEPQ
jgi:transposase